MKTKSWFMIKRVHPRVYALAEFSHWEKVVSYLVVDKTKAFLIDTGMGYHSIKKVVERITSLSIAVLLTHSHWDHIGGVDDFEKVYIFDNAFESESLTKGFESKNIPELTQRSMFLDGYVPKKYIVDGSTEFILLHNQQIIESESFNIQVMHTPGHTPGSVCFYIPELNVMLVGDTIYPGPIYLQMPESNVFDYLQSIKCLKAILNREVLIFPGHNAVIGNIDLIDEAYRLCGQLEETSKSWWGSELKGRLLSFLLPT